MPAYTTISNALVSVGAKPFATTIQALRDNPLAIAEGDPTAVAAGATIKDAALDAGAATAAGSTWVGLRTAGLATGAVGSYALMSDQTNSGVTITTRGPSSTLAGSSLFFATASGLASGTSGAGTWRCMGQSQFAQSGTLALTDARRVTLWLRIS